MRQIKRSQLVVNTSKVVIRNGETILLDDLNCNIEDKYSASHQELLKVYKERNQYYIEGVQPDDINVDVDENYLEFGEPTLPPVHMKERMYNVLRFLKINH
jgi:hypothetical protein